MKIKTEDHGSNVWEGRTWTAIDEDTYDGADDSHCPVGYGATEWDAVNDLVEQFIERLECRVDALKRENKALRSTSAQIPPETRALQPRGDLQIQKEYHHSGLLDQGHGEAYSEVITPDEEQSRFQGRMPDEPPEWDSGYDEPSPDR